MKIAGVWVLDMVGLGWMGAAREKGWWFVLNCTLLMGCFDVVVDEEGNWH